MHRLFFQLSLLRMEKIPFCPFPTLPLLCAPPLSHSLQQALSRNLCEMRVELPDSYMAIGVPDASGTIPAGCVVAMGPGGQLKVGPSDVLLYHHPGYLPEDIVRACAVTAPDGFKQFYSQRSAAGVDLRHPAPALYFSTLGHGGGDRRGSMATRMSTADFDGDEFVLIANVGLQRDSSRASPITFICNTGRASLPSIDITITQAYTIPAACTCEGVCAEALPGLPRLRLHGTLRTA